MMKKQRTEKTVRNMAVGFLSHFIAIALSFVSRTVFIHTLGVDYLGLNSIFTDVLALLSMADLGFNTAMTYAFYKPLAEKDEAQVAALTQFFKKIYRVVAVAVLVVGLAVLPFLRHIVNVQQDIPLLEVYYLFALAGVVISYLFVYKTSVLTADQKNYVVTQIGIWTNLARTLLQIAVLVLFHNYILYLAFGVLLQFISNALASRRAEKEYPFINQKQQLDAQARKNIFKSMRSVFLYKVSGTLFGATDNILISILVSTAMVGLYSNYQLLGSKLLLIIQIVFSAFTASVGNLIVTECAQKRYEIFSAVQSISSILCGVITCGFYLLAGDFVLVWLGPSFLLPLPVVLAVTLNTYLTCVLQPLWLYRDATGLYVKTKYIMLLGALLNLGLSVMLGHFFGLAGIIFASAIARLGTYFWYEPKLLFKEYFNLPAKGYYLQILTNGALIVLCIAALQAAFAGFVVDTWPRLIFKGAVCGGASGALFLLVYARTAGGRVIRQKMADMIKGRRWASGQK